MNVAKKNNRCSAQDLICAFVLLLGIILAFLYFYLTNLKRSTGSYGRTGAVKKVNWRCRGRRTHRAYTLGGPCGTTQKHTEIPGKNAQMWRICRGYV